MSEDYSECNAQIESTRLGYDREVFAAAWITLKYADGACQGFGGSVLDDKPTEPNGERQPTAWGMDYIFSLIRAVGVERWEDMKGKYVRVRFTGKFFDRKPFAIGHIIEDRWFDIHELAEKWGLEE